MDKVAHHLQKEAIQRNTVDRDIFARSAYNRYYYAVFLAVREMFTELNSDWSKSPHKSYPEILKGQIMARYKQAKTRANKNKDYNLVHQLDRAHGAAKELANLMEKAYVVRKVADYEPSETVDFTSNDRFSLKGVEITEAHSWSGKVRIWINDIKQAWRQINV